MDDQIDVKKAAEILGITEATVRVFARSERLPSKRIGKKVYLFNRAEVEAFKAIPRKPGNPGKPGRSSERVSLPDQLIAELNSELALSGTTRDAAYAEAIQLWIDDQRKRRRKKK